MNEIRRFERGLMYAILFVGLVLWSAGAPAQNGVGSGLGKFDPGCARNCVKSVVHAAGEDGLKRLAARLSFSGGRIRDPHKAIADMATLARKGQSIDLTIAFGRGLSPAQKEAQVLSLRAALRHAGIAHFTVNGEG